MAEPIVQQQGPDRIVVELAGCLDPARCKEIIGRTATLEVRMVAEEQAAGPGQDAFYQYKDQPAPFGTDKFLDQDGRPVLVKKQVIITGDRIKDAQPNFDQRSGGPVVTIATDDTGGRILRQVTRENVKKRMAMLLVEKNATTVLTWPVIQEELEFRELGFAFDEEAGSAVDDARLLRVCVPQQGIVVSHSHPLRTLRLAKEMDIATTSKRCQYP